MYGAEGEITQYYGDVKVTADGRMQILERGGSAEASIGSDGLMIDANAEVMLVTAEGTVTGEYGAFQAQVSGHASAGADVRGNVTFGKDGVGAGAEIFVGARAGVDGKVGAGGLKAAGGAEVRVGFGGGIKTEAGYDDGTVKITAKTGLTFIVGAEVEFGFEVDFGEAAETVSDLADDVTFWND